MKVLPNVRGSGTLPYEYLRRSMVENPRRKFTREILSCTTREERFLCHDNNPRFSFVKFGLCVERKEKLQEIREFFKNDRDYIPVDITRNYFIVSDEVTGRTFMKEIKLLE